MSAVKGPYASVQARWRNANWSTAFTGSGVAVIAPNGSGIRRIEVQIDGETRAAAAGVMMKRALGFGRHGHTPVGLRKAAGGLRPGTIRQRLSTVYPAGHAVDSRRKCLLPLSVQFGTLGGGGIRRN
jgi:hypothetical protein